MISGIYKLTFCDGTYYIGKSNDIDRRWKQHADALGKGKHAKQLQAAFEKCGDPRGSILMKCHPDHIDIMEALFINANWGPNILNSTRPKNFTEEEHQILDKADYEIWQYSTFEHIDMIRKLRVGASELVQRIDILERNIEEAEEAFEEALTDMKSGTLVEILEREKSQLQKELTTLKSRGFFSRLFNL